MHIVTPKEMEEIDRTTIAHYGLASQCLMENAARTMLALLPEGQRVGVLVGPGNNGGDGLVLARALLEQGRTVEALLLSESLSPDAQHNFELARRWGVVCRSATDEDQYSVIDDFFSNKDLLIDALFGTGLTRGLGGRWQRTVEKANASALTIVSVDIPSGVNGADGQVLGCAINAKLTVTFGLLKRGHLLYPGRTHCGELHLTQPGFHPKALERFPSVRLFTQQHAIECLPKIWSTMHKGDNGRLLMVTGSTRYPGAGFLSTLGALRSGAGLITHALPSHLHDQLLWWTPEAMPWPRDEALELDQFNAAVIGCGLDIDTESVGLPILESIDYPAVVDADALRVLTCLSAEKRRLLVATPHPGELSRLMDTPTATLEGDRVEWALRAAAQLGCTVCFKGNPTVTASPDGRAFINSTGNPVLAQGGTGDLLAGIIGSHLAYGLPPFEAAAAGSYIHGLAADLARDRIGSRGVPAHKIASILPLAYDKTVGKPTPSQVS